jgi:LuxR family maltose regulon positive regulatory protein
VSTGRRPIEALVPQVTDAHDVLLDTKLHAPDPRPGVVARPGLLAALGRAGARLTLVDAPAGWGKTTLLSEWRLADPAGRPFAWVSLDAADADPVRFWSYVLEALRRAMPALDGLEEEMAALRVPGMSPRALALPALINRLTRAGTGDVVLVLDDYHLVADPEIDADLAFLLDHAPPSLHVAIATRIDPGLPLARMRARGELAEVRLAELRFAEREALALLGAVAPALGADAVRRLWERTEGWAAGLYLAALSVRGRDDATAFVDEFAGDHRMVVDYLGAEVMRELPPERRAFLTATSILERLTAPLCEAVTGEPGAAEVLRDLERTNVFVIPLDERRGWYRYHHLFGDLLRHELALERTPSDIAGLHRRAGAWLAENGFDDEAVTHLIAAGALEEAADAILARWQLAANDGRLATVERWLDSMPAPRVEGDVRLCLARIWVELSLGRAPDAARWIATARRAAAADVSVDGFPDVEAAIRTAHAIERELVGDAAASAEATRGIDMTRFSDHSPWRSVAGMAVGMRHIGEEDLDAAHEAFQDAATIAIESGMTIPAMVCVGYLANIAVYRAEWDEAERLARDGLAMAEAQRHGEFPHGCSAHVALSRVALERGDVAGAAREIARARELAGRGTAPGEQAFVELNAALVSASAGDVMLARARLDAARDIVASCPSPSRRTLADLAAAEAAVAAAHPPEPAADGVAPDGTADLTPRERAVLRRLASELSAREIADSMYVSHNTVKTQVRAVYRKLGVASREEAVARAREIGLIR